MATSTSTDNIRILSKHQYHQKEQNILHCVTYPATVRAGTAGNVHSRHNSLFSTAFPPYKTLPTYPPTHSPTFLPTYPITHIPTFLPTHSSTNQPTYHHTHPLTHLPSYLPTYPPTHSPTFLLTNPTTHIPTFLTTHSHTDQPSYLPTYPYLPFYLPTHLPTHPPQTERTQFDCSCKSA